MPITVTVESAQHNFYQLVRQLRDGDETRVTMTDGGANIAVMVTWADYVAADPGLSAGVESDVVSAYSVAPQVYQGSLYKLIKNMRDRQAEADAQAATGNIAIPAGGGAAIADTETFTLTNTAGTATVFEFDSGGGITGDVAVAFTGGDNQATVSASVFAAINGAGIAITAVDNTTDVDVTQDEPGDAGNVAITEGVADAGFVVTGFAGGTDAGVAGGVVALRNSKNDDTPVVAVVPQDHATAIGL